MSIWIALLRGINVGGRNRLPMKDLVRLFEQNNCSNVRTYIQSGNVVFHRRVRSADAFARKLATSIEATHGFKPSIHLVKGDTIVDVINNNPYPDAETDPKTLHVCFLERQPDKAGLAKARALLSPTESFSTVGRYIYFHAPQGIARSKFASSLDRALAMDITARNWRTVKKISELVDQH